MHFNRDALSLRRTHSDRSSAMVFGSANEVPSAVSSAPGYRSQMRLRNTAGPTPATSNASNASVHKFNTGIC